MNHLANKLIALALLIVGVIPIVIEHDGTALIFLVIPALFLFFSKTNWVYGGK